MAQYAVLVYAPAPADPTDLPPEDLEALEGYPAQVAESGGSILGGYALQPTSMAKAVRGGTVTDGPFMDSEQVVTGVYVLEAEDLDHAVTIVRLDPAARRGGIEIRPLFAPPGE